MPLEGCPTHAAAQSVAWPDLSDGHGHSAAARIVFVPWDAPAAAECGKPQQFWGFSISNCLLGSAFSKT